MKLLMNFLYFAFYQTDLADLSKTNAVVLFYHKVTIIVELHYAVVTPLREAALYEQRNTNLGSSP